MDCSSLHMLVQRIESEEGSQSCSGHSWLSFIQHILLFPCMAQFITYL